jgi:AcrR family transcriptional regulator
VSEVPAARSRSSHRDRLLAGMAASVRERGFARTTVADVVREARVSRRTFYEHFEDLVDCYLALSDLAGDVVLRAIADAVSFDVPLQQRLADALDGWWALITSDPALSRSLALELHLAGERGIALLRRNVERTGRLLHDLVEEAREQEPELRPLPVDQAMIIAAGIRELVTEALEKDTERRLPEVRAAAIDLLRAVLTAPAPD